MTDPGASLAVELFTEELPPKALKNLGEAFAESISDGLRDRGFLQPASAKSAYATPRRLAVKITHVLAVSPDKPFSQKLMPANVALDAAGRPTLAMRKRLEALGSARLADLWPNSVDGSDRLTRESDGKAEAIFLHSIATGSPLRNGLQASLENAIATLPIPKVMTYQRPNGTQVKFARPAHRLLALHGADVVPVSALGLDAGRVTGGHRFLGRREIDVVNADAYEQTLAAEGKVIASFAERRALIVKGLKEAAAGATVIMPDALLDEVTALVEWPAVYAGTFDPAFLVVPQECLILTMQQNQKYFALSCAEGKLVSRFLLVSNIETPDPAAIIQGNERVLRARLADAKFFFDQDRKLRLEARVPKLVTVVYVSKLGTQFLRMQKVRCLAGDLADMIGADRAAAERAAYLAKADLVTDMVAEFPELQGLMGRYYAENDGEASEVAAAIEQHYWPRFAGDTLPQGSVAQAVALADKLESLTGLFGIGQAPTGDRDPLGLRRAGLGLLRILIERQLHLGLSDCVERAAFWHESEIPNERWVEAMKSQGDAAGMLSAGIGTGTLRISADTRVQLTDFLYERLRGYLRDLGFDASTIAAVVDGKPEFIDDIPSRLDAVRTFEALPEAAALAAANKRIINILRKSDTGAAVAVDRGLLVDGAELDLYLVFQKLQPLVESHCASGDYTGALMGLATAKPAIDHFFDAVMVMTDDPIVRANRLALLRGVAQTMNCVADISKLAK